MTDAQFLAWQTQYHKHYTANLDLATGELTEPDTGKIFADRSEWLSYVKAKRAEALTYLLERRDLSSDVQQLPGVKPTFIDEEASNLSQSSTFYYSKYRQSGFF